MPCLNADVAARHAVLKPNNCVWKGCMLHEHLQQGLCLLLQMISVVIVVSSLTGGRLS